MPNTSKTLVVGATGTVGARIVQKLREKGHSVRATSRTPKKSEADLEWIAFDVTDRTSIGRAFEGVDRAFLLSPPGHADQFKVLAPMITEAKNQGLTKVVLMTAMGVEANDAIPFRKAELELENSGVPYNIIRPNWFMQNFNTFFIHGILAEKKIKLPAGDANVSFIDARDISDSAAELLISDRFDNRAFTLTGPEAVDHGRVAAAISEATGAHVTYENVDPQVFKAGLVQAGLPEDYSSLLVSLFEVLRAGYAAAITNHVETITGQPPRGLPQYARDFRSSWTA